MERRRLIERTVRVGVFVLSLVPLARIVVQALAGGLGGNPIEEMLHRTGWWTLAFLVLTLTVTPIRQLTGIGWLVKLRRMLGLYAFFYAILHFGIYVGVDQFFAWEFILEDIMDRPYITVGFTALLILAPLAVTSTKGMVKRLGGRRWVRLHRLVYVAAPLGVLHFLWLVKADVREPLIFGAIVAALLGYRVAAGRLRRRRVRSPGRERARMAFVPAPQRPAVERERPGT
ncbi:MAG: sulfoxide reductase heme-binding subunit YedZ [Gemmatimonadota bacterium]|nr:MAG: sulfoxide reductase heme-binding subunit YedZ [Gemmatimonadota bacterium]